MRFARGTSGVFPGTYGFVREFCFVEVQRSCFECSEQFQEFREVFQEIWEVSENLRTFTWNLAKLSGF